MASPTVCFTPKLFFWNIDANVGIGSPNRPDDVQLVQLGYHCMSKGSDPRITPQLKVIFAAVVPGAPYGGSLQDPLSIAIRAHERSRGGTQDGHVSVIKSATGSYSASSTYMLTALDVQIRQQIPNDYPRLDKHPMCPPALRSAVVKACMG